MRLRIDRADIFVRMIRKIRQSRSRKQREAEIVRLPECPDFFRQRPALICKVWFHLDSSIYLIVNNSVLARSETLQIDPAFALFQNERIPEVFALRVQISFPETHVVVKQLRIICSF